MMKSSMIVGVVLPEDCPDIAGLVTYNGPSSKVAGIEISTLASHDNGGDTMARIEHVIVVAKRVAALLRTAERYDLVSAIVIYHVLA